MPDRKLTDAEVVSRITAAWWADTDWMRFGEAVVVILNEADAFTRHPETRTGPASGPPGVCGHAWGNGGLPNEHTCGKTTGHRARHQCSTCGTRCPAANHADRSIDPCPEWHCPDLSAEDRRNGKTCPEHPCTCAPEHQNRSTT